MTETPLTEEENEAALSVWHALPEEHRAFVVALQQAGMISGRRALANSFLALAPDSLPSAGGVCPCIETAEERLVLQAIKSRGNRQ